MVRVQTGELTRQQPSNRLVYVLLFLVILLCVNEIKNFVDQTPAIASNSALMATINKAASVTNPSTVSASTDSSSSNCGSNAQEANVLLKGHEKGTSIINTSEKGNDVIGYILGTYMNNLKLRGTFIEFGCADGITNSNSYPLEQMGWEGLCIEPNPKNYEKAKKIRKHVINALIAPEQEFTYAYFPDRCNQISGIKEFYSPEYLEIYHRCISDSTNAHEDIKLVGKPLEKILEEFGMQTVTYISTDCEGCEWQFIENFDFTKYDVQIFNYETNTVAQRHTNEINTALARHGFVESTYKGGDRIFTRPVTLTKNK